MGSGLALLSGALQASEYARHLGALWAIALGFGTPVLGEIGLSLTSALFSRSQRRAELRNINGRIEQAIVGNLDQAIASFDPSTIQRRIDRALNKVALAAVGGVEASLLALYGAETSPSTPADTMSVSPTDNENMGSFTTVDELSAARIAKASERKQHFFALVQRGDLALGDIASQLGVTDRTVKNYISEYRTAGHAISVNGVVKLA